MKIMIVVFYFESESMIWIYKNIIQIDKYGLLRSL